MSGDEEVARVMVRYALEAHEDGNLRCDWLADRDTKNDAVRVWYDRTEVVPAAYSMHAVPYVIMVPFNPAILPKRK